MRKGNISGYGVKYRRTAAVSAAGLIDDGGKYMSDSSTTLVPERIFIAAAEREQMEKRITSWMIEKAYQRL